MYWSKQERVTCCDSYQPDFHLNFHLNFLFHHGHGQWHDVLRTLEMPIFKSHSRDAGFESYAGTHSKDCVMSLIEHGVLFESHCI